jgi:hypothetical protein
VHVSLEKKSARKWGSSTLQPAVVALQHLSSCLPPFAGHPCGGVGWPPSENARQFRVSRTPTGSAAAREIAVVPIKSAFLALRSVP